MIDRKRLDQFLFDHSYADSREKAKAMIMEGIVYVNGKKTDKPGTAVSEDMNIEIRGNSLQYVSRGGLKLEKALLVFKTSVQGKTCLDCGASTGGFTDVLLQNGAKKVFAVDVGYGQLAWKLRNDSRVINLERTNARYLSHDIIPDAIEIAVMDASFISLKLLLPAVSSLLINGADLICLIKPQFEAGKEKVGKKGVVRDRDTHCDVVREILDFAPSVGLQPVDLDYSPIRGPEGNIEYIAHMIKSDKTDFAALQFPDIERVVDESHRHFEQVG